MPFLRHADARCLFSPPATPLIFLHASHAFTPLSRSIFAAFFFIASAQQYRRCCLHFDSSSFLQSHFEFFEISLSCRIDLASVSPDFLQQTQYHFDCQIIADYASC
jgi:hypothetical protein